MIYARIRDFREYIQNPWLFALDYQHASFEKAEALSRTREFCQEAAFAYRSASRYFAIDCPDQWMEHFRVMRFIDRSDLFLLQLNSDKWLEKWVTVEGQWPTPRPFVAITFHFGAGFWAFRHMRQSGLQINAVRANLRREDFHAFPVRYWYHALRNWQIDRTNGAPASVAGHSSVRDAIHWIRRGRCFVGLFDVAPGDRNTLPGRFLGHDCLFNRGLVYIASVTKVPIVVYTMRVREDGLSRVLTISDPIDPADETLATETIVRHMESHVSNFNTQWHNWGAADSFIAPTVGNLAKEPGNQGLAPTKIWRFF
jgi:hypothetical protein